MGERNGPLSPNIFVPAPPPVEGLKKISADQIRTPPTRGGGWRKACVEGRRKTEETPATLSGANCGEGGTGIAQIDPVTYKGTSESNERAPKAEHERPSSPQEEASTALDSYPSIIASSPAEEISSPPPVSLYSAEEVSSDDDPAFDSSENSLSEDEDNFAAQAPIEKPSDAHHSRNGLGAVQDLVRDGDCQQTSWSMHSDPAKRTSRSYSSHHSSSKNHSNLSSRKSSSSNLKNASQSSSAQSKDRPITKKSSRSPHSQAIGSHSSVKRSSRSPCSNRSKDHSPVKKSSQPSHASQSKNHSAVKRSSRSPLSSRSKNSSTKKRSSQSPHASRSKKRSHEKKANQSPHASPSKTQHSGAKRASRSPHGSRAKNHSSVKRSSRSPHSSRAKNHSPVKERSRLPHSSQSKNKSSTKKSSKSPQSAVKSSRHSPKKRSSRSPRSTHSRNKSPMQRTSHSRSRNRSPVSRVYSSMKLRLSPSRNRSLMRRIKKMFESKSSPCSRPRSRSRSPLRRTTRMRPSRSRSRSPLRRIGKLRSRGHSPQTISDRLKLSPSSHHIKRVKNMSESKTSPCFGVRVDISTDLPDDKTLKEVVFQRFVKYGFVTSVEVHHSSTGRYVLVFYDQKHEQQEALIDGPKTRLYSKTIEVTPWTGSKVDDDCGRSMWNDEMTKFSPASTRTLLIENLVKTIAPEKLDDICVQFDDILDIEVQQEPGVETCSALVEFSNITSLIKAGKALDTDFFGTSKVKVSFAKSTPTNCLWLDGLPTNLSLDYLTLRFSEYGPVAKTLYDCLNGLALVFYKHEKDAVTAMKELKCGVGKVSGHRVMVDYASSRTQLAFCQSMKESGENYLSD